LSFGSARDLIRGLYGGSSERRWRYRRVVVGPNSEERHTRGFDRGSNSQHGDGDDDKIRRARFGKNAEEVKRWDRRQPKSRWPRRCLQKGSR